MPIIQKEPYIAHLHRAKRICRINPEPLYMYWNKYLPSKSQLPYLISNTGRLLFCLYDCLSVHYPLLHFFFPTQILKNFPNSTIYLTHGSFNLYRTYSRTISVGNLHAFLSLLDSSQLFSATLHAHQSMYFFSSCNFHPFSSHCRQEALIRTSL